MQIRLVQVIFQAEMRRIDRSPVSTERDDLVQNLRSRSLAVLQTARAQLDGGATWHADISALIGEVEDELGRAGRNDETL